MHSKTFLAAAFAGVACAATPPGFQPSSNNDIIVEFGTTLASQGVDLPKALTQTQPTLCTGSQLFGSYSIILVDPDIPLAADGSSRGQFLHWLQTGLVSASTPTMLAGRNIFPLVASSNSTAVAPYRGPAPPAQSPFSHRYISLLVNTTGNDAALSVLNTAGAARIPFNAQATLQSAGLTVLAGSWFNVTNMSSSASPSASGSAGMPSGTGVPFAGGADFLVVPGAAVVGLSALVTLFL